MTQAYGGGLARRGEDSFVSEPIPKNNVMDPTRDSARSTFHNYECGEPIEFSMGLAHFVRREVIRAFELRSPHFYIPKPTGSTRFDGELKRFIDALAAYFDPEHDPVLSFNYLTTGILDKDFVKELKRIRFKAIVRSMGGRFCEPDEAMSDENTPFYRIHDVGQVFNYRFWFFWSEEDPKDEENSWIPIEPMSDEAREEFKAAVRRVIPKDTDVVDEREILMTNTSSSADSILSQGSSKPVYIEKQMRTSNIFDTSGLLAKLVYVQKTPGDTRRASVLSVAQSNTIKLIEKQTALIAEHCKYSVYTSNKDLFNRRYDSYGRDYEWHLMRDISKDGLTKNRELIELVFEVLDESYPNVDIYRRFKDVYKTWRYFYPKEDKIYSPPRGVGLGMSSAITSIIGCAIIDMTSQRCFDDGGIYMSGAGGLIYHDDTAIGFHDESSLEAYDEEEDRVFADLRLIKNKKKKLLCPGLCPV
jgi:hypothetical protein